MALSWLYQIDYGHPMDIIKHDNGNIYVVQTTNKLTSQTTDAQSGISLICKFGLPYTRMFGEEDAAILAGLDHKNRIHLSENEVHLMANDIVFAFAKMITGYRKE
jgi:hypothetical protein